MCLASKAIRHKLYRDLQLLPVSTHCWNDLSIDFVIGLSFSANWKGNSYDLILVIVVCLTKIVHYEPVKVTINAQRLVEVIINVVVRHYSLPDSIISNIGAIFISKFWFLLCYFFNIKQRLSNVFYSQING